MDDVDRLVSELAARGVTTSFEPARDYGRQLAILSNVDQQRLFCVAVREEATFILGFRGFFRLRAGTDTVSAIADLAVASAIPPFVLDVEAFSLEEASCSCWLEAGLGRRILQEQEDGWQRLNSAESERLWSTFFDRHRSPLSAEQREWPSFVEPHPFVTWSTSEATELSACVPHEFERLEYAARQQVLKALLDSPLETGFLYVVDPNHVGYILRPQVAAWAPVDRWPVSVIPIHNFVLYIDPSLTTGMFCHPREQSLCAFGAAFAGTIRRHQTCLGKILRASD